MIVRETPKGFLEGSTGFGTHQVIKSRGGPLELWFDRAKTEAYFIVMLNIGKFTATWIDHYLT